MSGNLSLSERADALERKMSDELDVALSKSALFNMADGKLGATNMGGDPATRGGDAGKSLLEIPDEIVGGLGADRQPDCARPDACCTQFVVAQLTMGRAGGVDDQALRVSDVRQMRPERDAADEVLSAGATALVAGTAVFKGGPGAYADNIRALRGG